MGAGIMAGGRFRCLGSPQRLKSCHGGGYTLEMKTATEATEEACRFVEAAFEGAELKELHGGCLKYHLPMEGISLSQVFRAVEAGKEGAGVAQYSVSQCSLEQVFVG